MIDEDVNQELSPVIAAIVINIVIINQQQRFLQAARSSKTLDPVTESSILLDQTWGRSSPLVGDEWCAEARMRSLLGQVRATVHNELLSAIGEYLPLATSALKDASPIQETAGSLWS